MSGTDLEEGWEVVLLASLTTQRVIRGRVRANKHLARLQLNGVPIPIKFRNIQMGPASIEVDQRARRAESKGLLTISVEDGKTGFPRHDYRVTDKGFRYTTDVILPTLGELAYGAATLEAIADLVEDQLYQKDEQLVQSIHRDLHLDDQDELGEAFATTRVRLREWSETFKGQIIRDEVMLAAAGTVDLALDALDAVQPRLAKEEDNSTGPYHILNNAERLARLLEGLDPLHLKRHKNDKDLVKRFDKILNGLETNCREYGLLHIPTEEEIDALFEEAAPFIPDQDSP